MASEASVTLRRPRSNAALEGRRPRRLGRILRGSLCSHLRMTDVGTSASHEHPRISGQSGAARIRRPGAARHSGDERRRSGKGRQRTGRAGLGGEGADPRRRPRQSRRRESGEIGRRRQTRGRAAARLDAGHPSDRAARQTGAPPLHRRRLEHRPRILSLRAGRPRHLAHRLRRLDRRRHGYRRSRAHSRRKKS